jgi:tRNA nucleotidyltransferase (CCA-adding enzyme)
MSDSVLSRLDAQNWPFSLEWLPKPVYMVGGAVRDAILGRTREYLDLDFIIPGDAIKVACAIAKHYQAGFVVLDTERNIARVLFPHATVDFAQQEGDSLFTDLHRRDFTINAIAYNPYTREIIDPLQGYTDIETGILRMISAANLQDDPLRLMRAYRQASQLGFNIEPYTQATIRTLAANISQVAAERVRVEIGYLLASSQGTPWLISAWEDGLLTYFFQNARHENLLKLTAVDQAAHLISENWLTLGEELQNYVSNTVKTKWLGIAKLACLVHQNPDIAKTELQEISYSRVEIRAVITALRLFPQFKRTNLSLREQYCLFQDVGVVFTSTTTLALADDILIDAKSGYNPLSTYTPLINRYLNPDDLVAHPSPLVSGREVIIALNIPGSPLVGKILSEIAVAQAEGKVSTVEEAIEFAKQCVEG